LIAFCKTLYNHTRENGFFSLSYELTFKLLLAVFPFLIFAMTVVGYMDVDPTAVLYELEQSLPTDIYALIADLIIEITGTESLSLLSVSFAVSLFSAASGFRTLISVVNRVYGTHKLRGFIQSWLLAVAFVFMFVFFVALSIASAVYISWWVSYAVFFTAVSCAYVVAVNKKIRFVDSVIGALTTVFLWAVLANLFQWYIANFTRYSVLYGGIGAVFVFVLWLNFMVLSFLVGVQVNVVMNTKKAVQN
jgi:membrane protein